MGLELLRTKIEGQEITQFCQGGFGGDVGSTEHPDSLHPRTGHIETLQDTSAGTLSDIDDLDRAFEILS